jgi:RNA polymerase sigma factor (sigma-70 family)
VVQEAFCGLYRRWSALSRTAKALSYLRSSVINGCRSALRRRNRQLAGLAGDPPGESAESAALVSEEHRQVLAAIRRLPSRQREALVLRFYLDEEEIAASMRISRGTVKSTTSRGRAGRWARWRGRRSGSAWLAPTAAAAAVILVGVLVITVKSQTAGPAEQGAAAPGPSTAAGYVASGQVPAYYVQITGHGNPDENPAEAVVHATATRAVLAVVPPLAGHTVVAVTAAADDRRFILDEEPWTAAGRAGTAQGRLVALNLTAAGHVLGTGPLPFAVPGKASLIALALSPKNYRVAFVFRPATSKNEPNRTDITVFNIAIGLSKTWSATGDITGPVSWTADEKELEFTWQTGQSGQPVTARLLDLSTDGGSLLGHSRAAATLIKASRPVGTVSCSAGSIITPDGTTVVCAAPESGFVEFSAKTGKLLRVLGPAEDWHARFLLWSDASGRVLIGTVLSSDQPQVGVISGDTFTPLNVTLNSEVSSIGTW